MRNSTKKAKQVPAPEEVTVKIPLEIEETLTKLNEQLSKYGLTRIKLVKPEDCIPAEINARYFPAETFQLLVDNIARDRRLESVPLVWEDPDLPKGKYRIISGHHRIDAAKVAGIEFVLVLVADPSTHDDLLAKQLAHNALVGIDDDQILQQLFEDIRDTYLRLSTGLKDKIKKIQYQSLNFSIGTLKEFTVLFLPEDIGLFDELVEQMIGATVIKTGTEVRLVSEASFEQFKRLIMKIKKAENIKSSGIGFQRILDLASQQMEFLMTNSADL